MWQRRSYLAILIILLAVKFSGCSISGIGEVPYQGSSRSASVQKNANIASTETDAGLRIRRSTQQPAQTHAPTPSVQNLQPPSASLYPTETPTETRAKIDPVETFLVAETAAPTRVVEAEICSPLEHVALADLPRVVSERYHPPPMGQDDRHQGVDFSYYHWNGDQPIDGTRVNSILGGFIAASVKDSYPFGNMIIVETPKELLSEEMIRVFGIGEEESLYMLYAHMNEESPLIPLARRVQPCEALGYVGRTGNTDAPHLHLEMRVGPMNWRFEVFSAFRDSDTKEQKQNYRLWRTSGLFLHFDPMRLLSWETSRGATATPTASRKD
ncbi:MAG: hypothetical protein B6D39_09800 [Anaerolineae bacterium UTCFX2]|jgi:murein DD-endopeptidase MepM/ murein hydrolase activator NlpD|nr:MAG: hypothetical protein B6D39_09800 [Anaerolineae bacterium UTCFX2]